MTPQARALGADDARRGSRSHPMKPLGYHGLHSAWSAVTSVWFAPIGAVIGLFDFALAFAVATETDGKMPGRAIGPVVMVAFGLAMFSGLALRPEAPRDSPTRAMRNARARKPAALAVIAAVAFATLVAGAMIGSIALLAAGAVASGVVSLGVSMRRHRDNEGVHRGATATHAPLLADSLTVLGVFPAIAFVWMVIPTILAVAVIAGVITSRLSSVTHVVT